MNYFSLWRRRVYNIGIYRWRALNSIRPLIWLISFHKHVAVRLPYVCSSSCGDVYIYRSPRARATNKIRRGMQIHARFLITRSGRDDEIFMRVCVFQVYWLYRGEFSIGQIMQDVDFRRTISRCVGILMACRHWRTLSSLFQKYLLSAKPSPLQRDREAGDYGFYFWWYCHNSLAFAYGPPIDLYAWRRFNFWSNAFETISSFFFIKKEPLWHWRNIARSRNALEKRINYLITACQYGRSRDTLYIDWVKSL